MEVKTLFTSRIQLRKVCDLSPDSHSQYGNYWFHLHHMLPCYEHKWVITDVRLWDMNQSNHNQSSCCTNHLVPLTATSVKLRRPKPSSIAPYSKTKVNISKFIDSTSTDVDILCIYGNVISHIVVYSCLITQCKANIYFINVYFRFARVKCVCLVSG